MICAQLLHGKIVNLTTAPVALAKEDGVYADEVAFHLTDDPTGYAFILDEGTVRPHPIDREEDVLGRSFDAVLWLKEPSQELRFRTAPALIPKQGREFRDWPLDRP